MSVPTAHINFLSLAPERRPPRAGAKALRLDIYRLTVTLYNLLKSLLLYKLTEYHNLSVYSVRLDSAPRFRFLTRLLDNKATRRTALESGHLFFLFCPGAFFSLQGFLGSVRIGKKGLFVMNPTSRFFC